MSNFLAIATVTATLVNTLQNAVQADVNGAHVTAVRPLEGQQNSGLPTVGVNLFLYEVRPNAHWRNADLPTRRSGDSLIQRPQAALDLHYLFSFYGNEASLDQQRLLGSTVAHLHSQPLLTRQQIQAVVSAANSPVAGSDLADQIELVRFLPQPMTLEEMSRLWSIMLQVRYTLSVAYQATVVLIEPNITPQPALPARGFNVVALPLSQPFIRRIVAQADELALIVPGSPIVIEGLNLQAPETIVEVDGRAVVFTQAGGSRISLVLPPGLGAGVQTVQVRHGVPLVQGVPFPAPGPGRPTFTSNLGSFVLHPVITQTGGNYDVSINNVADTGNNTRSADVSVGVDPQVGRAQEATLELLTAQGVAYTFRADARTAAASQLDFSLSRVAPGTYFFRVRVDGAESPLEVDAAGQPTAPQGNIGP